LPGIPTIRVFEALACGIPLVCAPWRDSERLFAPGEDYLVARDGEAMRRHLAALRGDPDFAASLAARGRATVKARHSCARRVDELLAISRTLGRDLAEKSSRTSDGASFETAASRPPQDEDKPLMPEPDLPHPEERPEGARLEGRTASTQRAAAQ